MANPSAVLAALVVASSLIVSAPVAAAAEVDTSLTDETLPTDASTSEDTTAGTPTSESEDPPTSDSDGGATTVPTSTTGAPTDSTPTTPTTGPDEVQSTTTTSADDTTTEDPLLDEEQGEEAPEIDETVPEPTGAYSGQGGYQPAEVLWSSVRAAETKVAEAQSTHDVLVAEVNELRAHHRSLLDEQAALGEEAQTAADDIAEAETTLRRRAIAGFMHDDALENAVLGSLQASEHDTILDFGIRQELLRAVLDQDDDAIRAYLQLRSEIDANVLTGIDQIRQVQRSIQHLEIDIAAAVDAIAQAEDEAEAFRAGSEIYIDDVAFPIGDGFGRPLIDSFGFPRMPGTPDEHWHEGIDIFAPAGTPLVATERGIVTRVGSGRLGGLTLWIKGESGAAWYYAHLQSHAAGLHEGMLVEAGDLVGYVGNTGNARGTPPHLHMEIHPGGGDPVNPYPLLKVISDRDIAKG
jgi:murein DD-endopeptidase MepM/ murein hydrolase activator NlpD